jgi:hypothetical protein
MEQFNKNMESRPESVAQVIDSLPIKHKAAEFNPQYSKFS